LARYESYQRELAYRIYVSDALRMIAENTARYGGGNYIKGRYANIINPEPEDDRTQEEIVAKIREGLRSL
jgi:hypothetical protein